MLLGWVDITEKPEEVAVSKFFLLMILQCLLKMGARVVLNKSQ